MGKHYSVLLKESIELLNIKKGGTYVDLTLGRGGHSSEILKRIPDGRLFCFDLDEEAIRESEERLRAIGSNFTIVHANFADAKEKLGELGISEVDGIIADLGVSSPQFDEGERGFSYRFDAPLDMRMDQSSPLTAKRIVNEYSVGELTRIFREYGEDRYAYQVALTIAKRREKAPIETTGELVEAIKEAKPERELRKKGHPAKQIFQALRIETNHELDSLRKMLGTLPSLLKKGGVMAVITFHSLEDRLTKEAFRSLTRVEGSRDATAAMLESKEADYIDLTRKPIEASLEELEENSRSRSAKLRAVERK